MLKFFATVEFLRGQKAAILELTTESGEWAGSGRIEVRSGRRADLYDEAYRQASLSATSKGGRLERFSVVAGSCPSRREVGVERRPGNALNVEIGAPMPRCVEKEPAHWQTSMGARWLLSGGDVLVFGPCDARCPTIRDVRSEAVRRTIDSLESGGWLEPDDATHIRATLGEV